MVAVTRNRRCGPPRRLAAPPLLLVLVAAAGLAAHGGSSARKQEFRLDHFLCYTVDPGRFQPRVVTLADQFGRRRAPVEKVEFLCNPVKKNREPLRNPRAHLVCYLERVRPIRARRVIVTNQFGRATLSVSRTRNLCLPSGKARGNEPPPPVRGLDHYACYPAKATGRPRPHRVVLTDQFGRFGATTGRVFSLCNPVSKNQSRVLNRRDHLTCFVIDPARPPDSARVAYTNQFERNRLTAAKPLLLCVPSSKRVVAQADLTVQIPIRTAVTCPAGQGSCLTTVSFTVSNPSAIAVATPFQVLIQADPMLGQTKTIVVAGLAAGASQSFSEILGPGNNCYDGECTVRVTVDSGSTIAESNEANNVATRTDGG